MRTLASKAQQVAPAKSAARPAQVEQGRAEHPVHRVQRKLSNHAMLRLLQIAPAGSGSLQRKPVQVGDSAKAVAPPTVHEVPRSPGAPLDAATRAFMESRFEQDFGAVRVHTDATAARSARAIDARAYTVGQSVYFASHQFHPGTRAGDRLIAHELAHTIQQRSGVRSQAFRLSHHGDAAEVRADAAADAIVSGRPVPDVGAAGDAIQRAVATNGGSFRTTTYDPVHAATGAVDDRVGAHIILEFMANALVESTKIGLIQTVKSMKSSVLGGPRDTIATGLRDPEAGQLNMGPGQVDPGRKIDRAVHPMSGVPRSPRPLPNTSPVYGVQNSPGSMAATLGAGTPTIGTNQWGSRRTDPVTHAVTADPARIDDAPWRRITFAGQIFENSFEAAAIAVEGPIPVDTYLGSVSWGWRSDAAGRVTLAPLGLVHAGAPSTAFMGAAALWNAATFHDIDTAAAAASVDIPITSLDSGTVAAADMSTTALLARITVVEWQIGGLAAGTDRTNKEFEKRALEAELRHRNVKVSAHVISTEDWMGTDHVYVKLTHPGGTAISPVRMLDDGDRADFLFPVTSLLQFTGPIQVEVYEQDSSDADDLIVDMSFAAPWTAAHNAYSMEDANYDVTVAFDR